MPRVQVVQHAQGVPRYPVRGVPARSSKWDDPVRYKLNRGYGDEFEHTSFASIQKRWYTRSAVTADFDFVGGSAVLWHPSASGSFLYEYAPSGDFQALLEYSSMGVAGGGMAPCIALLNSSGSGWGGSIYNDGSQYNWNISTWSYSGTGSNMGSTGGPDGRRLLVSLRRSGTTVYVKFSNDLGGSWSTEASATTSWTSSYNILGIGRVYSGSDPGWIMLHRLNVYSSQVA